MLTRLVWPALSVLFIFVSSNNMQAAACAEGKAARVERPTFLVHGHFASIGPRPTMEDEHYPHAGSKKTRQTCSWEFATISHHGWIAADNLTNFFGIYDGHAGKKAAQFVAQHLHTNILESKFFATNPARAIHEGFQATDTAFLRTNQLSGAAAVIAFVNDNKLYVANAGDSRAVLSNERTAFRLSKDHSPADPEEQKRIEEIECARAAEAKATPLPLDRIVCTKKTDSTDPDNRNYVLASYTGATGPVYQWQRHPLARVQSLAMSRAIGDKNLKPHVNSEPYTSITELDGKQSFLILACDGLWDVMTDQGAVDFVWHYIYKNGINPETIDSITAQQIAQALVETALAPPLNSSDNVSVTIIFFSHEQPIPRTTRCSSAIQSILSWPCSLIKNMLCCCCCCCCLPRICKRIHEGMKKN